MPVPRDAAEYVHLCADDEWAAAKRCGALRPPSLSEVGFVHLSAPQQVHLPANRLYAGRTDLVLLHVEGARLFSPVRWEPGVPSDPDGMEFPHLYGELPVDTVIRVTPYAPGPDGQFAPLRSAT